MGDLETCTRGISAQGPSEEGLKAYKVYFTPNQATLKYAIIFYVTVAKGSIGGNGEVGEVARRAYSSKVSGRTGIS